MAPLNQNQTVREVNHRISVERAVEGFPSHLALGGYRGNDRQTRVCSAVGITKFALRDETAATYTITEQSGFIAPVNLDASLDSNSGLTH